MKKTILGITLAVATVLSVNANKKHNHANLTVNTEKSVVNWTGKKVAGEHTGTIKIKNGTIHLHDGAFSGGEVTIDMTSIFVTDLKAGQGKEKLEGHLSAPDFFDVAKHATASLKTTGVKMQKENTYTISADLTIKGITKPIEFSAVVKTKDGKLAAVAEMEVDRTLYDIKYGSGKFFDSLGDKMIDDNFTIQFELAAE